MLGLVLVLLCLGPRPSWASWLTAGTRFGDPSYNYAEKEEDGDEEGKDFKIVATLEEKMLTFDSYSDDEGSLFVWGSHNNLYAAQIDSFGEVLIPAKKIASAENHITGIAKPIRWDGDGGWLIAIRETDSNNVDQIHLISMAAEGKVVQDLLWLQGYQRISLPVFLKKGKDWKAYYLASKAKETGLYQVQFSDPKKIPEAKLLRSFEVKLEYPPVVSGAVYDNAHALLISYRSKIPPPMKFFLLDQKSGAVLQDANIAHAGEALRLSEPVFQIVDDEVRMAWFESISKKIPPRLIELAFTQAGEISRKMMTFSSPDIPSLHLSWFDGLLSGVSPGEIYLENKPAFLHTRLLDTDPPSLRQTFIKPQFPENQSFAAPKLLQLDKSGNSGVMLANNELVYFSYTETAGKEKTLGRAPESLFQHFKECIDAKESKKKCLTEAKEDWQKEYLLKPFLKRYEKKYY